MFHFIFQSEMTNILPINLIVGQHSIMLDWLASGSEFITIALLKQPTRIINDGYWVLIANACDQP